MITIANKNF